MNVEEYNESVDKLSDSLYRFCLKAKIPNYEAEDIVQDVFEKLWKRKKEVVFTTVRPYLFRIVSNAIIDFYRRKKKKTLDVNYTFNMVTNAELRFEIRENIDWVLEQLSDTQKSAILLRDYQGYSYKEIGEIMELNESQVKIQIFRGRKKMKKYINIHGELRK